MKTKWTKIIVAFDRNSGRHGRVQLRAGRKGTGRVLVRRRWSADIPGLELVQVNRQLRHIAHSQGLKVERWD
jgi:hypothetical protein